MRKIKGEPAVADAAEKREIVLVLDNIRSLYNVGSMFRTADGFGVSKIYLCGYTGTPEQSKVLKVSLGAENSVAWEKAGPAWRTVERLRKDGFQIVGLEKSVAATSLPLFHAKQKFALVVGNEVTGLSPALLKRCDATVEIPMQGIKESFNVAVACGIGLYHLRFN
jgi:23S rRNA (guanosine2251-2'-O)-methyltransferase